MADTLHVDPDPPWKTPLEHRSAPSSPPATSTSPSYQGDAAGDGEGESRETSTSPKRLKVDDGLRPPVRERSHEREPDRHRKDEDKKHTTGESDHPPKGGDLKGKKLACPYFKRNPRREGRPVACVHPGFSNVARLKEHLYRIHKLPVICPRCQEQFASEGQVTSHLNAPERCEKQPRKASVEGFDREQELRLRTKKRSKGEGSEEEKWRAVFLILFPCVPPNEVPSAYVEHDIRPGSPDFPDHEARVLDGFEEFSRQEMPQVIARVEPGLLGERIESKQLLEFLRACQMDLFRSFRETGGYRNVTSHESVSERRSPNRSRSGSKSSQCSNGHMESSPYECSERNLM